MINFESYNLICNENIFIGYKEELVKALKDNLITFIQENYTEDVIQEELERLLIVRDSKYEDTDLIMLINNDEEKSHIPSAKIAKVKVLIPYGNGFSGNDVAKYML